MSKIFDMPIKTEPKWKFWLARILGRKVYSEGDFTFRKWRGSIWVFESKQR